MADWAQIRRACLRTSIAMGATPADADDVAQEAVVRTFERGVADPESYARRVASKLTVDALRARGRRGLTTGHGLTAGHGVPAPVARLDAEQAPTAELLTLPDQEDMAIAHETQFALLVAASAIGGIVAVATCRVARHRHRRALRMALGGPPGFKCHPRMPKEGSPDDGPGREEILSANTGTRRAR